MRSGFAALGPTYPMIPHTRDLLRRSLPRFASPSKTHKSPAFERPPLRGRLAELSTNESRDPSTEGGRFLFVFGLCEDPDQRFGPRWANQDPCPPVELPIERLHLRKQVVRELSNLHPKVLLDLREPGHDRRSLNEGSTLEGATEEQRGGQPVAGHMTVEADQMTGLLPAQDGVLPPKGLEHVAVADVRGHDADPVIGHQPVEAEVGHHGDNDRVDLKVEREDREDLVAVDDLAGAVHGEHAVAVSVEGHAEIRAGPDYLLLQQPEVGGTAADVDVRPIRLVCKRQDLGVEPLERGRGDPRVGAVRAVDGDREAPQRGPEPVENVLRVAVGGHADSIDRPSLAPRRLLQQGLDLLLGRVGELLPGAVEELDPVVLRRVVRGGDDDAEVERQQGDGGGGQHAAEHRVAADRLDARREGVLEHRSGFPRVAPDEGAPASGPERGGPAEPLHELGRQRLADDPANAICAEVAPHGARGYLFENCGALRALWRPAFLRSTILASRVRKPSRFSTVRSSGSASTSARASP